MLRIFFVILLKGNININTAELPKDEVENFRKKKLK